jgi:hypothetical protein
MTYKNKKYKVSFSIWAWTQAVPEPVARLQMLFKALSGTAAGLTFAQASADSAVYVGLAGIIIDFAFHCISLEEKV